VSQVPWYAARASGFVAWGLLLASMVWGLLLATKVLGRRPGPAWILSLHRFLGGLAVAFVGVHVISILADTYTNFGIADVLVPFAGSWHPGAVAFGIVAMYLLLAVEITSLVRDRLPARTWRTIHLLSYFLFATASVHMVAAGTDVKALLATSATVLLGMLFVLGSTAVWLWRSEPRTREARIPASRAPQRGTRVVATASVRPYAGDAFGPSERGRHRHPGG
jgi:DMSO/TMAO reductase YedYZ heme-binding membrane subunit